VFWGLFVLGVVLFVLFVLSVNGVVSGQALLSVAAVATLFGSLAWPSLSVKCHACGAFPVWHIIRHAPAGDWLTRVHNFETCPSCGGGPSSGGSADLLPP
jgi:hypothetical protein